MFANDLHKCGITFTVPLNMAFPRKFCKGIRAVCKLKCFRLLDLFIKDVLASSFCELICTWASSQDWSLINPISDAQMSIWLMSCSLILHISCIFVYKTHMEKIRDWTSELQQSHPFYSPKWLKELWKQDKYSLENGKWKQNQFALESKLMGSKPAALLTRPCCLL